MYVAVGDLPLPHILYVADDLSKARVITENLEVSTGGNVNNLLYHSYNIRQMDANKLQFTLDTRRHYSIRWKLVSRVDTSTLHASIVKTTEAEISVYESFQFIAFLCVL
jgi:hypothetical protein